jgi:hypothetical protein
LDRRWRPIKDVYVIGNTDFTRLEVHDDAIAIVCVLVKSAAGGDGQTSIDRIAIKDTSESARYNTTDPDTLEGQHGVLA